MNFRTTILLLIVLVAAGAVYFITTSRKSATTETTKTEETGRDAAAGKKLLDVAGPSTVEKITVTPATGDKLAFERVGTAEWRITSPVNAPADAFKVDDLVRGVLDLRTSGRAD